MLAMTVPLLMSMSVRASSLSFLMSPLLLLLHLLQDEMMMSYVVVATVVFSARCQP